MKLSVSFLALLPLVAAVQNQDNATARKLKGSKSCDLLKAGNGICDPENNDKDCGYDGGDCLIFQRSAYQEDLLQQYPELMAYNHGDYHGIKLADGKEVINCNRLTQCEWPGKQDSCLGDGTCDEDTVRKFLQYFFRNCSGTLKRKSALSNLPFHLLSFHSLSCLRDATPSKSAITTMEIATRTNSRVLPMTAHASLRVIGPASILASLAMEVATLIPVTTVRLVDGELVAIALSVEVYYSTNSTLI